MSALGDIAAGIGSIFKNDDGGINWGNVITLGGGIASALDSPDQQKVGYTGGIPAYTATREAVPGAIDPARRPGSGGRRYFTDTQYSKSGLLPGYPTAEQLAAANSASSANSNASLAELLQLLQQYKPGGTTPTTKPNTSTTPTSPPPSTPNVASLPDPGWTPPEGYNAQTSSTWTPEEKQYSQDQQYNFVTGDVRSADSLRAYINQAMGDQNISAGETDVIFNTAATLGISPAEIASMAGFGGAAGEQEVVNRLKADYPHLAYNYLNQFGHSYAKGGIASVAGVPRYLQGKTDGMADKVAANIDGKEEAALSHGEFVVPADVISALGNGNSDAGAEQLYAMMDRVRQAAHGSKKQMNKVNPQDLMPV